MNRHLLPIGLTLGLVAIAASAGRHLGQRFAGSGTEPRSASLVVAEDRLDFGEAFEQDTFRWTFPIENRGKEEIHITGFGLSCNCATVTPRSLTIPPGETAEVALTLDLTARGKQLASTSWPFEAEVTPTIERTNERTNERG